MDEDWLEILREKVGAKSQVKVAQRLGVSGSLISQVLSGKYPADLEKFKERVRGEFLGKTVHCPAFGELNRRACLDNQALPFAATNRRRVACWRACRSGCEHSFLENEYGDW